jgi:hypothetical protein
MPDLILPHGFPQGHRRTAQEVKKDSRQFIGKLVDSEQPFLSCDTRNLRAHVQGRAEAAVDVINGVTFLRSKGMAGDSQVVTCTGAVYQDVQASGEFEAAHRFPCTPWVGIFTVADLARPSYGRLALELKKPYAITDILPSWVNQFADKAFENAGPKILVADCVREVLAEQRAGKSPNPKLVRHVLDRMLLGFEQAYVIAQEKVSKASDKEFRKITGDAAPFSRDYVERLNQASIHADIDQVAWNRESVMDVLRRSADIARTHEPAGILPENLTKKTEHLEEANKSDQ